MNKTKLLEHYIYFLSTHRGKLESLDGVDLIHSGKPYFNIALPSSKMNIESIGSEFKIYIPEWLNFDGNIINNREKSGSLTFMTLPNVQVEWEINQNLVVRKSTSDTDLEDFSFVQGKGFCETEEEYNEWHPWMQNKNLKNYRNSEQRFYIGYKDSRPMGVCLSIVHDGIMGIYAVATLPEFRKQGISTTIMRQAIKDYLNEDTSLDKSVILQVMTNSYAHQFYKKLGFADVFACAIY